MPSDTTSDIKTSPSPRRGSLLRKLFLWALATVGLYAILGFIALPFLGKSVLVKQLTERLHRQVEIQKIKINPFLLTVEVDGLILKDRDGGGPFLSFEMLYLDLEAVSLFKRGPVLREIQLTAPHFTLTRNDDLTYNFSDLLDEFGSKSTPETPQADSKAFLFSLNNIRIENGSIDFEDRPKHGHHRVTDITLAIPFISNLPYSLDVYVQPAFQAKFNGTPVSLAGKTKPFIESRETSLDINISNFELPKYLEYLPMEIRFKMPSGNLDTKLSLSFTEYHDKPPSLLLRGMLALNTLSVRDLDSAPLFDLPLLAIAIESADVFSKKVNLRSVLLQSPKLYLRRGKDGRLNLQSLVPENKDGDGPKSEKKATKPDAALPHIEAAEIRVTDGKFSFTDYATEEPTKMIADPVSITAEKISTATNSEGTMTLRLTLNKSALLSAAGSIGLDPMMANLKLDLKNLDLMPLQPYFTERIKILVTSGAVSLHGNVVATANTDKATTASFSGDISLTKLATIDKANAEDFLKWGSLTVSGIRAGNNPLQVQIKDISLIDFYSRLIVNNNGTLNVQGILEREAPAPEKTDAQGSQHAEAIAQESTAPAKIRIENVTLQGGDVSFSDRYIKPNYSAKLTQLVGRISGISSEESKQADIDVRGQLGNGAPLEIAGKINPLSKDLFVDLHVDFKDIDLSLMTPYSGKYAGYTIERGKLSLTLKYVIDKRKLNAENKIFLDQFTFGDKVDSPDATKLPVRFAVSLLKDRNGEINLDLPVSGSLDDPQFSVWGVILHVITNLLTKAATSPFTLLASIAGGGQELSYVEFEYGTAYVESRAEEKLQKLAKVLYERPALRLDVTGRVDMDKDKEGLRQRRFERKLKAQKLNEIVKKGGTTESVDDITIEPGEYVKYLTLAYKKETFPKPRNILGMTKDLPAPEMERLMLSHIEITDEDLRELGMQRAQEVKEYLSKAGKIEPERIFLVTAAVLPEEKKEKLKESRVDFAIK